MKFSDEDRAIYRYELPGEATERCDDPLRLRRALLIASGGRIDTYWSDRNAQIPNLTENTDPSTMTGEQQVLLVKQSQAEAGIVASVRQAFGVPAVDQKTGEGVPDAICLRLYEEFSAWMSQKKTSGGGGRE